jgi:ribosomal protein S16
MKNETKIDIDRAGEINNDVEGVSENSHNKGELSRRGFISSSAGAAAVAAGSLGLMGAASTANAAVSPPEPESPDTSIRWKTNKGDLYNEKLGYGDEDVTGYKGRYVYGPTVGILQLPANIPMLPGDMGNPTTFDFPVLYELIEEIDPFWVLAADPHPEVMKKLIAACKRLTVQGVTTIIGNCGFFANYQPEVSNSLDPGVQFFNGSLMQVPMLLTSVGANKKVGVLTANAELLIPSPALKNSGVSDKDMNRVVIVGNENGKQMKRITEETGSFNPKKLEQELVKLAVDMVEKHPDIGAIVLECTEFPPYAHAIQDATRRNVWDFVTMTNFMHAGAMRKPYTGWIG